MILTDSSFAGDLAETDPATPAPAPTPATRPEPVVVPVAPDTPAGPLAVPGALDAGFEQLVVCNDPAVGLQAIICIDSTLLGPADGGVRMFPYPDFAAAVADVTRLARAMTLKWAAAGEDRGGGKAVIVGDPRLDKTEALLRRFGQFVDALAGAYWAGEDVGLTLADMELVHLETPYVATLPASAGGAGDIAPATAAGVLHAMRTAVGRVFGDDRLAGRSVALQGLGACGRAALDQLVAAGANVTVADVDERRVRDAVDRYGVHAVDPDAIVGLDVDVFAPFALGGVLDRATVDGLRARVVAGSANNQFVDDDAEHALVERGVVWAVDFVANAGGAIMDADRFRSGGPDPERVARKLEAIGGRIRAVLDLAADEGILPSAAARRLAESRLSAMAPVRGMRVAPGAHGSPGGRGGRAGPGRHDAARCVSSVA